MTDLSALVGKTVVAVECQDTQGSQGPKPDTVVLSFSDGSALMVRSSLYEEDWLDIDYDDGACHHDAGPLCLMGS